MLSDASKKGFTSLWSVQAAIRPNRQGPKGLEEQKRTPQTNYWGRFE
jgi:hypothetical protein